MKHRDGLFFSTKNIILQINQDITVDIIDTPDGGKRLIASGIDIDTIENLKFIVNTDQNNNYLYLEDFKVFVNGHIGALNIPGLSDIIINVFRTSDINAFLNGDKTHKPFSVNNFSYLAGSSYDGNSFSDFISTFTNMIPFTPYVNRNVSYSITLNPDFDLKNYNPNGWGHK